MSQPQTLSNKLLTIDASGVCLCLALVGAAWWFGARPVYQARTSLEEHRQVLEEQTKKAADIEGRVIVEQRNLADLKKRLDDADVPLFPTSDIIKRLATMTELLESNGLAIQHLAPGAPKPDPSNKFSIVPIRIAGTGSYTGVSGFLHELLDEKYPDVEVRAMTLNAPPENQTDAAFVMELRWYAALAAGAGSSVSDGSVPLR